MSNIRFWNKEDIVLIDGIKRNEEEVYQEVCNVRGSRKIVLTPLANGKVCAIDDLDILKQVFGVTNADDDLALAEIIYRKENPTIPEPPKPMASQDEVRALGVQMTDLELLILEGGMK